MSVAPAFPTGLGSVVVARLTRCESAIRCIDALMLHSRSPWELIVFDDGSDDETAEFLAGLRPDSCLRVEISREGPTLGRILALSRGEYVALVGGEAVVTDAWLNMLAALSDSNTDIGLVGPMTNDAPPPRRVSGVDYSDRHGMVGFADRWRDAHRGQWFSGEKVSGPCRLLKRSVIEALSAGQEGVEFDPFDDELSSLVEQAGYSVAVACDLFVHSGPWPADRVEIEQAKIADPDEVAPDASPNARNIVGVRESHRLRLSWEGDIDGLHSLGLINRSLCRALHRRGIDLGLSTGGGIVAPERLMPDAELEARRDRPPAGGPPQVWVAHRWPPRLDRPPEGKWAFFQPWEYGSLPRSWREAAGRADEVWAYSRSVRDVYLEAGIAPDRVHVVPLGVDSKIFGAGCSAMPLPPGPRYRFLFVGGTIHRKGIDVLLAAYERAFRPGEGIGLVVQDMGVQTFYRGQTAGAAIAALRARGYPIEHREDPLPPGGLARLYAACDCAVQPYRGEGFALPVAEAMASGLPVIVTGAGPALDYASPETAYLIPASRVFLPGCRVGEIETVGRPWLWEPDVDALADLMRRVASDPDAGRRIGAAAARSIRANFTWDHSAGAVEARLRLLAARGGAPRLASREKSRPKVSLTMIVRDEERNLPACLESARGLFDEIVLVDTGSTDRTVEIARSFGARVFDFVWVGDFASARNAALARATGDYAFWLDADDVLEPCERARLQSLLASLEQGDDHAYVVRCACDADGNGGGGQTVVDHIRLFPLRGDVRWMYRVHEQILPSLRRAGIGVRWSDVTVRHTGYSDPALRGRKLLRDEAILLEELGDRPDEPFVLFNLGCIAVERRDWRGALGYLNRSLAGSAPSDSITRKLYALIARSHQMLGETTQALSACATGLRCDPDDAELLFREAVIRRNSGDGAGAEGCWRRVLTLKRPEQFSSLDMGIYGHLTRRNLAALAEERGDLAEAERLWSEVLIECPGDGEAMGSRARLSVGIGVGAGADS